MGHRILQIILLAGIAVAFNVATMPLWATWLHVPDLFDTDYVQSLVRTSCWILNGWIGMAITSVLWKRLTLMQLFRAALLFDMLTLFAGLLLLLATNPIMAGHFQVLRLMFVISLLLLLAKVFHLGVVKATMGSWMAKLRPVATVAFSTLATLLVLEGIFLFVARSNSNNATLASKVWFARHWHLNPWGYRDAAEAVPAHPSKHHLVLVGDSFLAGHGIRDTAHRFSNLLQARLGPAWRVHNHGQNGASAEDVLEQLAFCPFTPDLILYCWFVNDIQGAARQVGFPSPNAHLQPPSPISLIHGSYFFNYLHALFPDTEVGQAYFSFLGRAYHDHQVLSLYRTQLLQIHEVALQKGAKFAVVLFPTMDVASMASIPIQDERAFWQERDVPCLYLASTFLGHGEEDLVVNSSDRHPNELAHRLAAHAIWKWLNQENLLETARETRQLLP